MDSKKARDVAAEDHVILVWFVMSQSISAVVHKKLHIISHASGDPLKTILAVKVREQKLDNLLKLEVII